MSPPHFLCDLYVLYVLYCGIVGFLWWLASFVSCTVVMSMLLVFMMYASSVSLLCIPFMLICRILRSCLLCCADCDCWWLITGVVWGGLGVGEFVADTIYGDMGKDGLVVKAIWGVVGVDAQVADVVWEVLSVGRFVADALVGDVVCGLLGVVGLLAGTLGGVFGVDSRVAIAVWGEFGGDWLVLVLECVSWVWAECVECCAYFQEFVYWVGVMFAHVMRMYPVCCGVIAAYRCLWFGFDVLTAQIALPHSTGPQILLDVPTEEQPSYKPCSRPGPESGYRKNAGFGPSFGGQEGGVVICPPFRVGYPNLEQDTTLEAVDGVLQNCRDFNHSNIEV